MTTRRNRHDFIYIDLDRVTTLAEIQQGQCDVCGITTRIEKYGTTREGQITQKCVQCVTQPINRYIRGPVRGRIYMITNTKNYRIYIGSTIKTLEERLHEHYKTCDRTPGRLLYRAMRRHGKETFHITQIEENDYLTQEAMYDRESFWIRVLNTHESGYNEVLPDRPGEGIDAKRIQGILNASNEATWETYKARYRSYEQSPEYLERVRRGHWENINWLDVYKWCSKKRLLKMTDEAEIRTIAWLDTEGVRIRSV